MIKMPTPQNSNRQITFTSYSKFPFTEFRWIGPYIIEKALPNKNYLVRKIGTNQTQVPHRIRLRQFTLRQPIPDIQITPQEWKPDQEVLI